MSPTSSYFLPIVRSTDGLLTVRQRDDSWPRGLVVMLWLMAAGCLAAAAYGQDEARPAPWVGYAAATGFALFALAIPWLAPWWYEVSFDIRRRRWRQAHRSFGLTRRRSGGFAELEGVALQRIESQNEAAFDPVFSYRVSVQVRGQPPMHCFETARQDAAQQEASRLAAELGLPLLDRAAV